MEQTNKSAVFTTTYSAAKLSAAVGHFTSYGRTAATLPAVVIVTASSVCLPCLAELLVHLCVFSTSRSSIANLVLDDVCHDSEIITTMLARHILKLSHSLFTSLGK